MLHFTDSNFRLKDIAMKPYHHLSQESRYTHSAELKQEHSSNKSPMNSDVVVKRFGVNVNAAQDCEATVSGKPMTKPCNGNRKHVNKEALTVSVTWV